MLILCRPCISPFDGTPLEPSKEGTNHQKEECPICKKEMWVTDLKRQKRKEYPSIPIICMPCGLEISSNMISNGLFDGIEIKDMTKLN